MFHKLRPCHTRQFSLQRNGVALQVARKTSSRDTPCLQLVSQQKIALQVAEKVEAASTFPNATRQVAACDTPTATCVAIFLGRDQSQYDIIRMPLTFLNIRRAYNIISLQVAKQVAYVWHPNCNLQYCFRQKLHCKLQGQIASCDMAFRSYVTVLAKGTLRVITIVHQRSFLCFTRKCVAMGWTSSSMITKLWRILNTNTKSWNSC